MLYYVKTHLSNNVYICLCHLDPDLDLASKTNFELDLTKSTLTCFGVLDKCS